MKKNVSSGVLGIIGGMGPLADITFLERLHSLSHAERDSDYLPILYDGNCRRPDRSDYLLGKSRSSPRESLYYSLRRLEYAGADVIAIPCNTAHFWLPYLRRKKRKRTLILNMIYEAARECCNKNYRTVCLLATGGTYQKRLYSEYFFRLGVEQVLPSEELKNKLSEVIYAIKRGERIQITELEAELSCIKCDAFVIGCTELSRSLALAKSTAYTYVDSLDCLARKALSVFGKQIK